MSTFFVLHVLHDCFLCFTVRRCFCQGHCPFGEETGTCELKTGGVCFASAEAIYDQETDTFEPVLTFGCLADGEGSIMQVSTFRKKQTLMSQSEFSPTLLAMMLLVICA